MKTQIKHIKRPVDFLFWTLFSYRQKINYSLIIIFLINLSIVFSSCEKKINWDLNPANEQFLIVDGIITNEYINQSIKLTLSLQNLNDSSESVSGAVITVNDGENNYSFTEDSIKGNYISDVKFTGVINKIYSLSIKYNTKEFFANADMIPIIMSEPIPYKQIQDTNLCFIAADNTTFNPDESAMYEIILDWSKLNGYENLPISETTAHLFYYKLTTIDVNQIFAPENEIVLFPVGTQMIQKKYSLSTEHEKFIRSLLTETLWHGGNFDVEEGNVYTNMSEGALGFFGACSVITFSSIVQ